jgi:threonyl-tRNA synthetase
MLVYGPPLDTGFYYDIAFPADRPLKEGDFEAIEAEMAKIVKEDRKFTRYEMEYGDGIAKLNKEGSKYKIDNAHRAHEAGSLSLSWYATGEPGKNWEDLCRGPHVPSTGRIGAFKIMSLASVYWHGDENSDRLTRVYGTAFFSKKDLDEHLTRIEEAKKRDHRVLGKQLHLFHIDDTVGQGLILWTPRVRWCGRSCRSSSPPSWRSRATPRSSRRTSASWTCTGPAGTSRTTRRASSRRLSTASTCSTWSTRAAPAPSLSNNLKVGEIEGFLLKPMNCPHHIKIFDSAASTATATCRCVWPSSARCTAGSSRAN